MGGWIFCVMHVFFGPRHTPNLLRLRKIWTCIKLDKNFFKIVWIIRNYSSTPLKTFPNTLSIRKTSIFWFKKARKTFNLKNVDFLHIFGNPRIWFVNKWISVDQVLTKICQIDPKLIFNVFHILNHDRISKIEKIFDGPDPPPKGLFLGGDLEA